MRAADGSYDRAYTSSDSPSEIEQYALVIQKQHRQVTQKRHIERRANGAPDDRPYKHAQ